MTTYRCPGCGHESDSYELSFRKEGMSEGFYYVCTEGWDIICTNCHREYCMEHEDNEACNYVSREEIVVDAD